jgi:hypothetical protein
VDRLPVVEWAGWWDKTIERWREEGLPAHLADAGEIRDYLGLDCFRQHWITPRGPDCPAAPEWGAGIMRGMDDYVRLKPHLYPMPAFDAEAIRPWARKQKEGQMVVWITLDGFFWFPRTLLGIERHLLAFHDQPELINRMNADLVGYHIRVINEFCRICTPQFMTFAEDMSYNHGPMISKECFDEFLAPYYRKVVPALKERDIRPMVDSDGNVTNLIPWLEEVGIEGVLPLERRSGVDVGGIRRRHPQFRMIGGFDKTVMKDGKAAMRHEFERLLPVMRSGGFIPAVDHQTPPDVSLEQYRLYVSLLREYCEKAAR